jgi:DHA1 family bicyclomycin/chloramphenicol resistance-like MFS transporter
MSAITLVLAGSQLPETNPRRLVSGKAWRGFTSGYGVLLASKPFWGFSLVVCGMFAGIYAFIAGSPVLFIDQLGVSPAGFGVIAALSTIGSLGGNVASNWLTVRLGIERLVLLGSLVMTVAGIGMYGLALAGYFDVIALIAPMMLFGVGLGLAMPNAYAGVVSLYPAYAGTAAALTGCLQMVFAAAGSLLVAWLPKTTSVPLSLVIAAAGLMSLLGWLALGYGHVPPDEARTASVST